MNAWFPKIDESGRILSGNDGIWLTDANGSSKKIAGQGTTPFWLNTLICYNRNDGKTQIGNTIIDKAYNEYYSFGENWTGFDSSKNGSVDFYTYSRLNNSADGITQAKYSLNALTYIAPYQSEQRTLVYNNTPIYQGKVLKHIMSPVGLIAWQVATGTYTRLIMNQSINISIKDNEDPQFGFDFLGQTYIVTQTNLGTLIYPIGSHFGYYIGGDLYFPDGRVFGSRLRIVGSTAKGEPRFDNWIDLLSPRIDLRNI